MNNQNHDGGDNSEGSESNERSIRIQDKEFRRELANYIKLVAAIYKNKVKPEIPTLIDNQSQSS